MKTASIILFVLGAAGVAAGLLLFRNLNTVNPFDSHPWTIYINGVRSFPWPVFGGGVLMGLGLIFNMAA
ncbi:hypothetical protein ACFFGT_05495 [Mucilaginibacter angelicae]|uniref:DUF2905 domain-containing protein n=1 Tax=Mucilaginibacter angelicae TaxID=869718 RepID=A0ABV6L1N6_9SPHI